MPDDQALADVKQNALHSVRQFAPSSWGGFIGDSLGFLWPASRDTLPAWGTTACDFALRVLFYKQHNGLVGGGVQAWIEKFLTTPYEISGGRNLVYNWQDLFFESEFGQGYDELMTPFLVDYLTLNRGGFLELVSYGDPETPLKEGAKILGINHLDAMRIIMTGNLEYPYLYQSEWNGQLHKMHRTRVIRIARQPSPQTLFWGMGKSALYDAISLSNSQILLGRHQNEMLSDLPPPGIVIFNNVKPDEVETAMRQFDYERIRDGQNVYRAPLQLSSLNPSEPASVTFSPLATVPEGFNYKEYMDIHVNLLALALGLDPQDIWPLSSHSIGSAAQSGILQQKTSGKGPGYFLTRMEREWNKVLPREMEWKYKAQNEAQDKQTADVAAVWMQQVIVPAIQSGNFGEQEMRELAAAQIPAFADVLQDEQGQITRLFDADPKTQQQITATDATQMDMPTDVPDVNAIDTTQVAPTDQTPQEPPPGKPVQKATGSTSRPKPLEKNSDAFKNVMEGLITAGVNRTITKTSAKAQMRGAMLKAGKQTFEDTLSDYGIDELDEYDDNDIADCMLDQEPYLSDMVDEIYSDNGLIGTPENRAEKWAGAIALFYYAAVENADSDGMYTFVGDDGKESCATCQSLVGQTHRMSWWVDNELRPGVDHQNFECGTWEGGCAHYLEADDLLLSSG